MKIGALADETGTTAETIRYYESEGLIPAPERTGGNYRVYGSHHVERLAFIRHCRSLDMALSEIRALLHFKDDPQTNCGEVNGLLDEHIGHVAARIRELMALETQLKTLRALCRNVQGSDACGILRGLAAPTRSVTETAPMRKHIHGTHR